MDADALNIGLLLFRSMIGVVMLAHGINHIFGGGKIAGTAGWFQSLGMRPGILHAWLASITEVVAGVLLVLGFLMPLAGAAVVGILTVAFITNHRKNGFFIFRPGEGYEYVVTLIVCGITLGTIGGGEWSVDHGIELWDPPGMDGLLISAIAGFGSAAGLLAVFWRPQAKEG